MYLSRLTLNPRTRRVQRELANPYELHRTLLRAYPDALLKTERILYRVETDPRSGVPAVLLQSHARPDWAWLGEPGARDYLLAAPQTKAFELTLTPGQLLAFRLRANPTARRQGFTAPIALRASGNAQKPTRTGSLFWAVTPKNPAIRAAYDFSGKAARSPSYRIMHDTSNA